MDPVCLVVVNGEGEYAWVGKRNQAYQVDNRQPFVVLRFPFLLPSNLCTCGIRYQPAVGNTTSHSCLSCTTTNFFKFPHGPLQGGFCLKRPQTTHINNNIPGQAHMTQLFVRIHPSFTRITTKAVFQLYSLQNSLLTMASLLCRC